MCIRDSFKHVLNYELRANTDEADDDPITLDKNEDNNEDDEITRSPSIEEVKQTIMKLKNNTAPGNDTITAEMLKLGGTIVVWCLHELVTAIWKEEEMPVDWHMGIIHLIFKKGDKTLYENYRPITLLNLTYEVFKHSVVY